MKKLHSKKKPYFIILYGPTGVGKTDFSLELAQALPNVSIINADLGQLYTPLNVGTAKPNLDAMPVPHLLFNRLDEPVNFTVQDYRTEVLGCMSELWNNKKIPILVGGSGFYLKSLLFPPHELLAHQSDLVLQEQCHLQQETHESSDQGSLWQALHAIDPQRAVRIHPHDEYRLRRALAIWRATGKQPSHFAPVFNPPANFMVIHLTRSREDLYNRIQQRTALMMRHGWLDEVKEVLGTPWESFLCQKKLIGYDDIVHFLRGENSQTVGELTAVITQKTRNYAKRQETFWRMLARAIEQETSANNPYVASIKSINLTLSGVNLYIKELSEEVKTYL